MHTLEVFSAGLSFVFGSYETIFLLCLGVLCGLFFGSVPGLTGTLAIAMFLPFTFGMNPVNGIAILMALHVGSTAGGLVSATLLNIPGTPAAIVTCFDGAPMARNGKAHQALFIGSWSSLVGGLISAVFLVTLSPQLARVALMFGYWEYLSLGIFGIFIVVSLTSQDKVKGFMGICIGSLISMVGMDPLLNEARLTFGIYDLNIGMPIVATLMGLFAMSEILSQTVRMDKNLQSETINVTKKIGFFPEKGLMVGQTWNMIRSSLIGTAIGILPGVGSTTSSLMAYNQAKSASKDPDKFGTGCIEGVVASETANNANVGGALVPLLALGIPGSTVCAILMGGFTIHGLTLGPILFRDDQLIGGIFLSFIIANILMFIILILFMKFFIKILSTPLDLLLPVILVCCVFGAYSINNRIFDTWVFLVIGVLGFLLVKNKFTLPTIVLGFILGPIVEKNFRIAMISSGGSFAGMFKSPIAIFFLLAGLAVIIYPVIKERITKKRVTAS